MAVLRIRDRQGRLSEEPIDPIPPSRSLSDEERQRERELAWEVWTDRDGRRRQRPTGSTEAMDAYAKANPFSARMFDAHDIERVEVSPGLWVWELGNGRVIEGYSEGESEGE